jgi:NAD(P)H-dependent flavin oxidoreductase YrpB (nitropropane dioxygenase family)
MRASTSRPFAVNHLVPALDESAFALTLAARPPVIVFALGDPGDLVQQAHEVGSLVLHQVTTVQQAREAAERGVDVIIAQGGEAGGYGGTIATFTLLPQVVDAVRPLPVVAAGGIATGRGVVAALSLGAQAVSMGTRFLASVETDAVQAYKERVVQSRAEDTVYTVLFDVGWPDAAHRVIRNKAIAEWEAAGYPASGQRPGEGSIVGTMPVAGTTVDVVKYMVFPSLSGFTGDIDYAVLYAGESCGLVHDIKPAAQIVRDVVREAEEAMEELKRL